MVVGLGSSLGVRAAAVRELVDHALEGRPDVAAFATVDRRRDEPGLLAVVRERGAELR
ncbi:MAG: cobalamin biosynthesis protein, partial [Pseudonocardiaceae bacterium]